MKPSNCKKLLTLIGLIVLSTCLQWLLPGQTTAYSQNEIGRPLIHNYSAREYGGGPQTSTILQDEQGLIYVANNSPNLVQFDGVRWRQIALPKQLPAKYLALDEYGRVCIGAVDDFGYLAPDAKGTLQFQSLLDKVKPEDSADTNIIVTVATVDGVFFISRQRVFRWKNNELQALRAQTAFMDGFVANGRFYVQQQQIGLMQFSGNSLQPAPGGERLADQKMAALLPYSIGRMPEPNSAMLVILAGDGMFLFDRESLRPFPGEISEFVKETEVYSGRVLNDSLLAIATSRGAVIFDANGKIRQVINKNAGLANDMVFSVTPDREGGLWLATLQGVARVNTIVPVFTIFDEHTGIDGVVSYKIIRHRGTLYVETTRGIKYWNNNTSRFETVAGLAQPDWSLVETGGELFAVRETIRSIDGRTSKLIEPLEETVISILQASTSTARIFLETVSNGVRILERKSGEWQMSEPLAAKGKTVRSMAEEGNGYIWFGLMHGLIRLHLDPDWHASDFRTFDVEHGLPKGHVMLHTTSLGPIFAGPNGILRFDTVRQGFVPDSTFGARLADGSQGVELLAEDSKGNIWLTVWEGENCFLNVARRRKDSSFRHERNAFLRLPSSGIWAIYPEDNGHVWFGGEEGLLRYDDNVRQNYAVDFPVLVRQVIVNGDSSIYDGALEHELSLAPELSYANNALRFECAAPSFADPGANRFQYFLEGIDPDWSNWTQEAHKDYTNLNEGLYTFRVRAQNVYEHVSSEGGFSFRILPPWYRSWWAYTIYGLIVFAIFYSIRRYEMGRQQFKHNAELRAIETAKLQEMDALKSRFFANISHEFRTPLTLIIGPLDQLAEKLGDNDSQEKLSTVKRNAQRLLSLINELLDLAKLEAGKMTVTTRRGDLVAFTKHVVSVFSSIAEIREITLQFASDVARSEVYFDHDKMEKVFANLLGNAFKFTPNGGAISVTITQNHLSENRESVEIRVSDTGTGIPAEDVAHIFDRFYQARDESGASRDRLGTGIGMALTKELVEMHHGSIAVESQVGQGTTVIIRLPFGKAHLQPEEIIDDPADSAERDGAVISSSSEAGEFHLSDAVSSHAPDVQPSVSEEVTAEAGKNDAEGKVGSVLVVEDNPDMCRYIRSVLPESYQIAEAFNGRDGLETALTLMPDLIISDVMMPKMNGYQLCEKLKTDQRTSHIPVILLTAKAGEQSKIEGLETGADAYLTKPFSPRELHVRMKNLIEQRRKLRKRFSGATIIKPSEVSVVPMDQVFLEKVVEAIEAHIDDEHFSLAQLSSIVGMSVTNLNRKLNALIDQSAGQLIRSMRLQRAADLIKKNAGTIAEIAYRVGFSSQAHFTTMFRKQFNCSPSEFKKQA